MLVHPPDLFLEGKKRDHESLLVCTVIVTPFFVPACLSLIVNEQHTRSRQDDEVQSLIQHKVITRRERGRHDKWLVHYLEAVLRHVSRDPVITPHREPVLVDRADDRHGVAALDGELTGVLCLVAEQYHGLMQGHNETQIGMQR